MIIRKRDEVGVDVPIYSECGLPPKTVVTKVRPARCRGDVIISLRSTNGWHFVSAGQTRRRRCGLINRPIIIAGIIAGVLWGVPVSSGVRRHPRRTPIPPFIVAVMGTAAVASLTAGWP
jgi:hypothetical protein